MIERAVQSMEQYLRTLKSALDERMGGRIDVKHPILTWLCEYAGYAMNRLEVSADGKTAYERNKGKKADVLGIEFGEKVLWKYATKGLKLQKVNARWGYGLFIGVRARSNELIIVDQESKGINYVRTVRRVPEVQRWSAANLEWVSAVPWNKGQEDDKADGEAPEFDVKQGPGRRLAPEEVEEVAATVTPQLVHRAHLRKADFEKYGFTDQCGGCSAILRGLHIQPHTTQCRERMEGHLENDLRVKNAKVRLAERNKKLREEEQEVEDENVKRRRKKLEDIEAAAMDEEDLDKLAKLFEDYKDEYQRGVAEREDEDAKRRKLQGIEDEVMQEEDPEKAHTLFQEYIREHTRQRVQEGPMKEVASGSGDPATYEEQRMSIDQVLREEWMEHEQG